MTDKPTPSLTPRAQQALEARRVREAAALRENLRRRKQRQRADADADKPQPPEPKESD